MQFTESEAYLINYIENNSQLVANMSITELSELANVSTATIVRAVKKLGFKGFTEYKLSLQSHLKDSTYYSLLKDGEEIKSIIHKNQQEILNTIQNLDIQVIDDVLQHIEHAHNIYIFARGLSEHIAEEMEMKLHLLNKRCELYTDPNIIRLISKRPTQEDISCIISLNGETQELIDATKILQEKEVTTILITANKSSRLAKLCDITLFGYKSTMSYFPEYEVRSRLPLYMITRIILDALANRYYNQENSFK